MGTDSITATGNQLLAELRGFNHWVCYRSKADKQPLKPDGSAASIADSSTWASYEQAAASGKGLGFVITRPIGVTCIDIDVKEGAELSEFQKIVLGAFRETYIETSPSGRGFHIWCRGTAETVKRSDLGIEVYSGERYMTVTLAPVVNSPLLLLQEHLDTLIAKIRPEHSSARVEGQDAPETRTRADIINAIALSPQGQWFNSLWSGDWTNKPSASEADWQLCCLLMEHGATNAQVESIFLDSQLGQRDKAKEMWRKIRTTIRNARAKGVGMSQPQINPPQTKTNESEIVIQSVPFSQRGLIVEPMDKMEIGVTEWLWYRHLPKRRLALLAGVGSAGKSTLTLKMAATVSTGGTWPDGTQSPRGRVLLWSGEDLADEDVLPRLVAMGADLSMIANIKGTRDESGNITAFNPVRDVPEIINALKQYPGTALVVISPLVRLVKGDMNATNVTREGLQSLVDMAQQTGVCVLGISHFRKDSEGQNPVDRVLGSAAFTQLPRSVMGAVRSKDGARRALAVIKGNNGKESLGAYEYEIRGKAITHRGVTISADDCSEIVWGQQIEGTAHDVFDDIEGVEVKGDKQQSKVDGAKSFLLGQLANGRKVPTRELNELAAKYGISTRAYNQAKTELSVASLPDGVGKQWVSSLPDASVQIDIPVPEQWARQPN
jgi:putative DNA primase/helicase